MWSGNRERRLRDGFSLMRIADYDDVAPLCEDLARLRRQYPKLGTRGTGDRKDVMLQAVRARAVNIHKRHVGRLTISEATEALRTRVPSLTEAEHVTATWVDTQLDPHNGAVFVTIVPGALDLLRLCRERYKSARALEEQAESSQLGWPQPMPDLTVAYVPASEPPSAVEEVIRVSESHLPLRATLLPAL